MSVVHRIGNKNKPVPEFSSGTGFVRSALYKGVTTMVVGQSDCRFEMHHGFS